jgi:hypothetical protein
MLTISRPDIARDSITEYKMSERFIKLPIAAYLKLLPATDPITFEKSSAWEQINDPQIALINAVNNPAYRFICAALARRLGKTYIANIVGQLVTLIPGCNVLIMSPNYNLSSISFEIQRKLIKSFDLEVEKDNLKDRVIELSNGSTVRMGSLSTVDSCVGRSYDLIIFDEAALGGDAQEAFEVSLRPTLDKPNSKAIFISTPRGRNNWFSIYYQRGFSPDYPQWASLTADYSENKRMKSADVEEARRTMTKGHFEQEYMASFTTFEGQIYNGFDAVTHCVPFDHTGGLEYIAGLDPGYRDPTAFIVIAYNPSTDVFHVVDEYQEAEAVTSLHAEKFQELSSKYGIETIFIDSAAAQFGGDLAYSYNIGTIKAKKQVLEGIAYVQTLIVQNRLLVDPRCTITLAMLDQYRWKTDTVSGIEKPEHNEHSHMADALRYALYSFVTGT